ncbi:sigma factor-like helix-turn-helix DNA-binding protein [Kitasatospora azatica]|uniref:sigma factor-like helix-turn-helix DNA-binding protein n=1 Tax=Kitasatospora azatica TaxID=58347 RepID=UPI00068BEF1F|nr:sigma factor-like helix-turn-helix DNA-binding protein [Kitasatospora azatica]
MCQDGAAEPVEATLDGFEQVYARTYPDLLQQTFLLTAGRRRAARAVRRAFGAAWLRWPELAAGPDPVAWLRAHAFESALAPWRRVGPRRTHAVRLPRRRISVPPMADTAGRDRALLKAVRRLSRPRRRAVLLHDALGLPPAAIAAEVEASTAAVAARVAAARRELAHTVPALVGADPEAPEFGERLGGLLYRAAQRGCPRPAEPRPTVALRARGRVRAATRPVACGVLVLATVGAFGSTLAGHPLVTGPAPAPRQHCASTGGAGPAAIGAGTGPRSPWCTYSAPDR